MGETTTNLDSMSFDALQTFRRSAFPMMLLIFLVASLGTTAHFMGDTNVYTRAILRHQHGLAEPDYHQLTANPFWDFGHVLWRPLGWVGYLISKPVTASLVHHSERAEVILALVGISYFAALGCVVLFFILARLVVGDSWAAALATVGLFSADAFLNYAHTGHAYLPAMACLIAGMYVLCSAASSSVGRSLSGAILLAMAVLFWFPYIFVLPAAFAAPLLLCGRERQRLRMVGLSVAICAVVGLAVYGATIAVVGIRSMADLRAWIMAAGHGQIQPGGLRVLARLAFSVPRSFINMGRDGMLLKRYLVHDPYAPVAIADLFRLSLWKLLLFYASAAVVCVGLLRSESGRKVFVLLASAVMPIVFFGVFMFQAGSIDLYLPIYPFVFLAWAYVFASPEVKRPAKVLLLTLLGAIVIVNVNAMRRGTLDRYRQNALARIGDLVPTLAPTSLVLAVNEQDSLAVFCQNFPLDPINLDHEWQYYDMLEINAARVATWREDLAKRVLWNWQNGGNIWVPLRVLQDKPEPDWNWVEGDDARVRWSDLPAFFSLLQLGTRVGGGDGFVALPDVPANRKVLTPLAHEQKAR